MGLKVIARYSFPHEAHIAKELLALEGVAAFISDEHIVSVNWLYANMVGGVKLWVMQDDLLQAQKILTHDYSDELETEFGLSDSKMPQVKKHKLKKAFCIVMAILFMA